MQRGPFAIQRLRGHATGHNGLEPQIGHIFERICKFNGVEKRHTKPYHSWTNGMVERMNRTIKESTIKAYEYEGLEQLREHVQAFVQSYNFGKHLKALRWKTPFRAICEAWEKDSSRFRLHPHHLTVGLNRDMDSALLHFGAALHAIQDAMSPSHSGFQLWTGQESAMEILIQIGKESIVPSRDSPLFESTKKAWEAFKSGDINGFTCPCK